jgi:8-oxo-dGTP pyrophosphatase MutT (NUDIX family)
MEGAILTAILARLGAVLAASPFDTGAPADGATPPRERAPAPRIRWRSPLKDLRHAMRPLRVGGVDIGYVDAPRAARLERFGQVFRVEAGAIGFVDALTDASSRTAAMAAVARELAREGALSAWRDELYAVCEDFGAAPLFLLERAAARYFGIHTFAAHVNGVVAGTDGPMLWFARRSPSKAIDPGQLDNLVGGGIAAGRGVADTVVKEASEEAGIDAALAATARPAGSLYVERLHADGLQRETIFVHDLDLPASFVPANQDGEVVEYRRVALDGAAALIAATAGPDVVTVDASVVVLDFLRRYAAFGERSRG